jgi:ABC-type Fe3+ transport system permease subunit
MSSSDVNIDELKMEDVPSDSVENKKRGGGLASLLLWLIGIFIVAIVVFVLWQPSYVLDANGNVDFGKAALAALIVALIGVIIIALVTSCRK